MRPVICIMSRDEEESIAAVIGSVKETKLPFFVCDGHSSDRTIGIAKSRGAVVLSQKGKGKGSGMREALTWARKRGYDTVVSIDCDLTYPAGKIPILLAAARKGSYGMIVGRRETTNIPPLRRCPNIFFNWLVRRLYSCDITDMLSGLRAIRLGEVDEKELDASGFDIETELTIKAVKKGVRIKEIPIPYYRRRGISKLRARDGFVILGRILREKL